jgi:hypothetical protein
LDLGLVADHLEVEERGFVGPGAVQAPARCEQLLDEVLLVRVAGLEVAQVDIAQGAELLFGLVIEKDAAGAEAVGEGGGVGTGAAFGGHGSARAGAIGAGRLDTVL